MATARAWKSDLVAQLRVPGGWEVVSGAPLPAGWLGTLRAPLAVLAPGPGGPGTHRVQLVVFAMEVGAGGLPTTDEGLVLAAAAHVPEAWRIDETRGWTEVFRAPYGGRYRSRTLCFPGEAIVPLALTRLRVVPINRRCAR